MKTCSDQGYSGHILVFPFFCLGDSFDRSDLTRDRSEYQLSDEENSRVGPLSGGEERLGFWNGTHRIYGTGLFLQEDADQDGTLERMTLKFVDVRQGGSIDHRNIVRCE